MSFYSFTMEEIELLRQRIIQLNEYTPQFIEGGPLTDSTSLLPHIKNGSHLSYLFESEFSGLPLLIRNCPEIVNPLWHKSIIVWRLEIGK